MMDSVPKWGGHQARQWTTQVLARYGTRCHLAYPEVCTGVATTGDHLVPRSVDLSRQYDVSNGRPACLPCNQKRGAKPAPAASTAIDTRWWFEGAANFEDWRRDNPGR